MAGELGFYNIIQFVPDVRRSEGINVGLLVCVEGKDLLVVMTSTNADVSARLGAEMFDADRLTSAKRALSRRLGSLPPTAQAVQRFISMEGGNFLFTAARPMLIVDFEDDFKMLYAELVG